MKFIKSLKAGYKMKNIRALGLLLLSIFLLVSCDITNLGDEDVFTKVPVKGFKSIKKEDGKVIFEVYASYPNGCGSFSHSEYKQTNRDFNIDVYGKQKEGATCTDQIKTIEGVVELNQPLSGPYKYSFWQSDTSSLDTTLVF